MLHLICHGWILILCFLYVLVSFSLLQLGKTKVFLRAGQIGVLDSRRSEVLDSAAKCIQGRLRTFFARRDFLSYKTAAISLQACCRGQFRIIYQRLKSAMPILCYAVASHYLHQ